MKKIKIAITGGPSGGKTTLIETLKKDMTGQLTVVPEAASLLYRGGFPRRQTSAGKIHAQRSIYFIQKELEELIEKESDTNILVCDRGSLDSIAYWPDSADNFFENINSSESKELARYDWLLHLDTADQDFFDTTNPVRTESHVEALNLDQKIKIAWKSHPRRVVISHSDEFLEKISKAKKAIKSIIKGMSYDEILSQVSN